MTKQHPQHPGPLNAAPHGTPVLQQTPAGWTVYMADANGNNVLNLAVFPTKFLAEEALARIVKRQAAS